MTVKTFDQSWEETEIVMQKQPDDAHLQSICLRQWQKSALMKPALVCYRSQRISFTEPRSCKSLSGAGRSHPQNRTTRKAHRRQWKYARKEILLFPGAKLGARKEIAISMARAPSHHHHDLGIFQHFCCILGRGPAHLRCGHRISFRQSSG